MIINKKFYNKKIVLIFVLFSLFFLNLFIEYNKFLKLIDEEIYETNVEVINIYEKTNHNILRLKADNFEFFTNIKNDENIKKSDLLNITFISKNLTFLDYLKGFYTTTLYFDLVPKRKISKIKLSKKLNKTILNHL